MAAQKMQPPRLVTKDPTSLSLSWEKIPGAVGYKVRYRRDDELEWSPLSSSTLIIKADACKKKNLTTGANYIFSIVPCFEEEGAADWAWSVSSEKMVPGAALSPFLTQLLPQTLVKQKSVVPTADALAGRVVAVYFSASWCGPCRAFTPVLAEAYQEAQRSSKPFEVVFVSCDRDESDWREYYSGHHPWLSVAYGDARREELCDKFQVRGIPRLCVLRPSGEILADNVGAVSAGLVDGWVRQCGL